MPTWTWCPELRAGCGLRCLGSSEGLLWLLVSGEEAPGASPHQRFAGRGVLNKPRLSFPSSSFLRERAAAPPPPPPPFALSLRLQRGRVGISAGFENLCHPTPQLPGRPSAGMRAEPGAARAVGASLRHFGAGRCRRDPGALRGGCREVPGARVPSHLRLGGASLPSCQRVVCRLIHLPDGADAPCAAGWVLGMLFLLFP